MQSRSAVADLPERVRERLAPQHRRGQNTRVRSQLRLHLQLSKNFLGVPGAIQDESNVAHIVRNCQKTNGWRLQSLLCFPFPSYRCMAVQKNKTGSTVSRGGRPFSSSAVPKARHSRDKSAHDVCSRRTSQPRASPGSRRRCLDRFQRHICGNATDACCISF